jgi:D-alanyl-D-alanine carboxypeptidase
VAQNEKTAMTSRFLTLLFVVCTLVTANVASARPTLVIDANSGRVLHAVDATQPWFPASLTKLMTTYVVLNAIKQGRVSPDTPLLYTQRAQNEQPSKMGLPVNTIITVDNALKILIVKSANDLAVTLAEGVGGNVENFVVEMNATAQRLGMTQSHFVNPNGWFDPTQVTTARDMAILARALYRDFPQSETLYRTTAIQLGKRLIRGHNAIIGRFDGADGMKTGFTCPSGFNLVASAKRGDRRIIAVVLGENNARERTQHAAELLESGFGSWTFWRTGQEVQTLPAVGGEAPNMRAEICERKKVPDAVGEVEGGVDDEATPVSAGVKAAQSGFAMSYNANEKRPLLLDKPEPGLIVSAFLGPNLDGPPELVALAARMAPPPPPPPPASEAAPAVPKPKPATAAKPAAKAKPSAKAKAKPTAKPKPKAQ